MKHGLCFPTIIILWLIRQRTALKISGNFSASCTQKTAAWVNRLEAKPKRKVWHNFWETRLTFQKAYYARLKYVHHNAVHHGLVAAPNQYPWCSAALFERVATPAQSHLIYNMKIDAVSVMDTYEPLADW